jgi:serine/threonine protein kinase
VDFFALAKRLEPGEGRTYTTCGDVAYRAPEMVANRGHGVEVDWWALGILVFDLLTGSTPYADASPFVTLQNILLARPPTFPKGQKLDKKARKFVLALVRPKLTRLGYVVAAFLLIILLYHFFSLSAAACLPADQLINDDSTGRAVMPRRDAATPCLLRSVAGHWLTPYADNTCAILSASSYARAAARRSRPARRT